MEQRVSNIHIFMNANEPRKYQKLKVRSKKNRENFITYRVQQIQILRNVITIANFN